MVEQRHKNEEWEEKKNPTDNMNINQRVFHCYSWFSQALSAENIPLTHILMFLYHFAINFFSSISHLNLRTWNSVSLRLNGTNEGSGRGSTNCGEGRMQKGIDPNN